MALLKYYTPILTLICIFSCSYSSHTLSYEKTGYTIAVLGTGYVGLVTGAGLAEIGNTVICSDIDTEKIALLKQGKIPIYEPGLDTLVAHNVNDKRLSFTDNVPFAIDVADIILIAVGTPMATDGSADLSAIKSLIDLMASSIKDYKLICTKSTVPVGTGFWIKQELIRKGLDEQRFDIVSNPEFLREGCAVTDFLHPDRIVIGTQTKRATDIMKHIYREMINQEIPIFFTDIASSETIKYASNAMLATKIAYINEIANFCKAVHANIYDVARGMGMDKRIGPHFLNPGPGFGGSCFPKDCQALIYMAHQNDIDLKIIASTLEANEIQKQLAVEKLIHLMGPVQNKVIAILGLAFKANTDDIRYSPAIATIQELIKLGASVKAYDPAAKNNMRKLFPEIEFTNTASEALTDSDACIVLTEWEEFKKLNIEEMAHLMRQKYFVDMRGIIDQHKLEQFGFKFEAIGSQPIIHS
jgi:UDPglucose 6-dehydrogenase